MARKGGSYFVYKGNIPYVVDTEPYTKQSTAALVASAGALTYKPKNDSEEEQRFKDMELMEVMTIRLMEKAAKGDFDATTAILDRILGKPKQETQNVNVNVTYADYLDSLPDDPDDNTQQTHDESPPKQIEIQVQDAQVINVTATKTKIKKKRYANLEGI
jgi:hypothetical protein